MAFTVRLSPYDIELVQPRAVLLVIQMRSVAIPQWLLFGYFVAYAWLLEQSQTDDRL